MGSPAFDLGAFLVSGVSSAVSFQCRAVATSIAAYSGSGTGVLTASANGAIGSQDGVTLVAGDCLLVQAGLANVTAKDSGPWVVSNPGGASAPFVLTRPSWWAHGSTIIPGNWLHVGGEGTLFPGSTWKSFAVAHVVDVTDPALYPDQVSKSVTLVAGTAAAVTTIPCRPNANVLFLRTAANTCSSTAMYSVVPALTAGYSGTASIVPMAVVAAGTINAADVSTLQMTVHNW